MNPFTRYLPKLEAAMHQVVPGLDTEPALLYGMLNYHLGWADKEFRPTHVDAGKRLRPIFLLLCCEAQGGNYDTALPAAVAVELLHNFSLIHDDIEDQDAMRRGRPTLWAIWGMAQGINTGDALFTLAYRAMFGLQNTGLPAEQVLYALDRYNITTLQLTEGQCLDMSFEKADYVAEETYLKMVAGKTAALLALSCELGGIIAQASKERVTALHTFGHALGMAFQMQDDLLGLWGNPARTGKPVGSDLQRHKKTLPILHGLSQSEELRTLLSELAIDKAAVDRALEILETTGSRAYTEARAQDYHNKAMEALERAQGSGEAQEALLKLAERLLNREK
ncbi:MAG: polyprenyl synthetase family protein [Anaerolineae bacterium]|nr:polyprenyl synthetase family protein [Anaerolineae bacterium]